LPIALSNICHPFFVYLTYSTKLLELKNLHLHLLKSNCNRCPWKSLRFLVLHFSRNKTFQNKPFPEFPGCLCQL